MNYRQVSRITLTPDIIDCIVFWTKDPTNILNKLDLLKEYSYYFQITVTSYDKQIERNVASKNNIIASFKKLSAEIGKKKTIWRYDPIILTQKIDIEYHCQQFESLAAELSDSTERCIISFVDMYRKSERNIKSISPIAVSNEVMIEIGEKLSDIACRYGLKIETCSESVDLSSVGIGRAKCIDDKLIADIIGKSINIPKDKNQRDT